MAGVRVYKDNTISETTINGKMSEMYQISDIITERQKYFSKKVIKPIVTKVLKELEPKITEAVLRGDKL